MQSKSTMTIYQFFVMIIVTLVVKKVTVTAVAKVMIHIMLNTNGLALDQRIHGMNIQMPTSELEGSTSAESVDQGSPGILLV